MMIMPSRTDCSDCTGFLAEGPCIPRAIAAQATRNPEGVALSAGDQLLRYGDLDGRANRVPRYLHSLGVGADVLVGLCLPRSLDMVVAALGILKADGRDLPL